MYCPFTNLPGLIIGFLHNWLKLILYHFFIIFFSETKKEVKSNYYQASSCLQLAYFCNVCCISITKIDIFSLQH